MQKKYGLKIGDDVIYFTSIDFDDITLEPIDDSAKFIFNVLSKVDLIMDITDLPEVPIINSTWNGNSFSENEIDGLNKPFGDPSISGIKNHSEYNRFAFLQNNVLLTGFYYRKNLERHEALIAALSSNPQVVEIE